MQVTKKIKANNNSFDSSLKSSQEEKIKSNIGYNCPECSSLIEIISINDNILEFKCINNENHSNKIKINDYFEKMKKYIDDKNLNDKCENHNDEYKVYCLNCKSHLCKECLPPRMHKTHNKKILGEEKPNKEELNIIKNKIEYYNNKIKCIKQNQIKEEKNELNNNKININENLMMKINKIKKFKELKTNKDIYMNDLSEIKRKYENEIKLLKIKYLQENNKINNKYKILYNNEKIINNKKIKELNTKYNQILNNVKNDKEINDLLYMIKFIEIILNTYNVCQNNYYYSKNIINMIHKYKNEKIDKNEIIVNNNIKNNYMLNSEKDKDNVN